MRIAIVTPGIAGGGTERVSSILANGFARLGHKVHLVCCYSDEREYKLCADIEVNSVVSGKRGMLGALCRSITLVRLFRTLEPDVVLSFVAPEMVLSEICGVSTVQTLRNDPWHFDNTFGKKLMFRAAFSFAKSVVFQTQISMEFYPPVIQKKGTVLNNPIDTDELPFWQGELRKHELIATARLSKQKNYPMMIKAFSEFHLNHPDWHLTIYGEGSERQALENLIDELGLTNAIALPGHSTDILKHMADSSVFVLSSNFEGVSNAMLEALCIGMPCIVTDYSPGGAREYIENGVNGLLVRIDDAHGMAKAMAKLADEPEFARKLGKRALGLRDRVDCKGVVRQWESVLKKSIE